MKVTLREEDGRALDLLLDRARLAAEDGPLYAAGTASQERVQSAEKVLALLRWLPDFDPPHDLVDRTLRLVSESADGVAVRGGLPLFAQASRPHA